MQKVRIILLFFLVLLSLGFVSSGTYAQKIPELKVAFLDVGQGDAIFIQAPNGNQMIVDGGRPGAIIDPLSRVMPFGDRSIDVLVVTNPDLDHYAGFIDVLREYSVGSVIESGTIAKTKTYELLHSEITKREIPHLFARKGMTVTLDSENGVVFEILFPDRDMTGWSNNDSSLVGRLVYGENEILFTGDATTRTEQALITSNSPEALRSDILKVGHHGSRTSTSKEFLSIVNPSIAIVSLGAKNSYGHPHKEPMDVLERAGVVVFRTDKEGTIIYTSDGRRLRRVY
jgi:competence protein ComEC